MSDTLRLSLLAGSSLARWEVTALERVVAERDVELTLLVRVTDPRQRSFVDTLKRAVELREWAVVACLLRGYHAVCGPIPEKESVPIEDVPLLDGVPRVDCTPALVDGWKIEPSKQIAGEVADRSDAAIFFAGGFLIGPILDAPTHGVLGFHHGDIRKYRGQPAGFWEYVHDEDEAGVTLQRYTETLDGGEIVDLRNVSIADADRWRDVRKQLYDASKDMLVTGTDRLRDDSFTPTAPPEDELGELYTLPKGYPVAKYVTETIAAFI